MIEVFNEISKRMMRNIIFYSEMADMFDFLSLHGLKRVMETRHIEEVGERRGLHRYVLNHLNKLIMDGDNDIQSIKVINSSWYSYMRTDVDVSTRNTALIDAIEQWIKRETETKSFYEGQFKVLTDNSKIAEADKVNELILCSDKVLKEAVRIMLDYKAVNYDMAYVLYGQNFLHDKFEKRLKDGFKIEMC